MTSTFEAHRMGKGADVFLVSSLSPVMFETIAGSMMRVAEAEFALMQAIMQAQFGMMEAMFRMGAPAGERVGRAVGRESGRAAA